MAQPLCECEDLFKESWLSSQGAWLSVEVQEGQVSNTSPTLLFPMFLENVDDDDCGRKHR